MTYLQLVYLHLGTVFPAFLLGTYLMIRRKGTKQHKLLGKIYMVLMLFTAIVVMFMSAKVGPVFLNHFGFIHLLSFFVVFSVPLAYYSAKKGNIARHRAAMKGVYFGGVLIAGAFAFAPNRLLYNWIFG